MPPGPTIRSTTNGSTRADSAPSKSWSSDVRPTKHSAAARRRRSDTRAWCADITAPSSYSQLAYHIAAASAILIARPALCPPMRRLLKTSRSEVGFQIPRHPITPFAGLQFIDRPRYRVAEGLRASGQKSRSEALASRQIRAPCSRVRSVDRPGPDIYSAGAAPVQSLQKLRMRGVIPAPRPTSSTEERS